jgi:hypothetical protein
MMAVVAEGSIAGKVMAAGGLKTVGVREGFITHLGVSVARGAMIFV